MKKVAITGATSMLGLALVEDCIANGVQVLAFIREDSSKRHLLPESDLIHIVHADMAQLAQVSPAGADCDVFYHFAWAFTDKSGRSDTRAQTLNIQYTLDAIQLAHRLGCKKFIGAGSQAEYGIHVDEKTGPESPADPQIPYGVAKYAAGKLGSQLARQLGMDFIWMRIFSVYGPHDLPSTMISSTIRKLRCGEHVSFSPAVHNWDYLYVTDAAKAFYQVGAQVTGHRVFCLGWGQARPLREYIQELADVVAPGAELGFGEIPYAGTALPHLCADISALEQATGWTPTVPFREGIAKTAAQNHKTN